MIHVMRNLTKTKPLRSRLRNGWFTISVLVVHITLFPSLYAADRDSVAEASKETILRSRVFEEPLFPLGWGINGRGEP